MKVLFLKKLGSLLRRSRFDKELDEEMCFHREQVERAFIAEGMEPEAARYAAMRQFGNATRAKEKSHEVVGFHFESVMQDVRYALRQLAANPGFTAVITLTLALSIGANSAIFSVIEGVLLKPLPYPHAEQIVRLFLSSSEYPKFPLNPFDFRDFRARNKSFQSMAAFTRGDMQLSGSGEPLELSGFRITAGYFRVLGLTPSWDVSSKERRDPGQRATGNFERPLMAHALQCGAGHCGAQGDAEHAAVHGDRRDAGGHGASGNDYHSLPYGESVDVWWPFEFAGNPAQRGSHYMEGIGRLKDGVTAEQANAEMNALMAQLGRENGGGADGTCW